MDPTATWELLVDCYENGQFAEAQEAATDLMAWLLHGGFPPHITGKPKADRFTALAVCIQLGLIAP